MASTTYGFSVQAFLRILTLRLMDLLHTFPHLDLLIVLITLHLLPHCNLVCLLLSCLLLWDADLTHYLPQAPLQPSICLLIRVSNGTHWQDAAGNVMGRARSSISALLFPHFGQQTGCSCFLHL